MVIVATGNCYKMGIEKSHITLDHHNYAPIPTELVSRCISDNVERHAESI
jgi:hypothetical protein